MNRESKACGGSINYGVWFLMALILGAVSAYPVAANNEFRSPVTAEGNPIVVEGRLVDRSGSPVRGGTVEFWQTDARGIYDHPGDRDTADRDQGFQFYGSSAADQNGYYSFRTILPGRYEPRPRHIHVKVRQSGKELLTTQIYFAEDGETRGVGGNTGNLRVIIQNRRLSDGKSSAYAEFDFVVDTGGPGNLRITDRQGEGPYYPLKDVSLYDNDLASIEN